MFESTFVGYVGDADLHDGSIVAVEQQDDIVRVHLRGASGKAFVIEFNGVRVVRANRPEGMLLYALSEMTCQPPERRFVFANWDNEDTARLEIDATDFSISEE
jgi:hypothetical protein